MNKLGAWKVGTIPSGRGSDEPVITFVYGEDELERATVAMRQWLTFTVKYGSVVHGSILNDWKEVPEIKGLLDTDVSDLAQKMSNEQLQGFVSASGKKTPMIKKLYKRLHHDLKYPLSNKQASMIKVDPWPVKGGQLCAARQRLAFAVVDEILNMLSEPELLPLIGEKHKSLTKAGGPLAQNLHSVVIRSEEQATATGAAPGPDARRGGGRKKTKKRKKTKRRKKTRKRKKTKKRKRKKRKTRKKSKRKTRKKRKKTKRK
jgi:hypothetical protein